MSKQAKRIIATAALLILSGVPMPATVARELGSFRSCGSDEVLYDPNTDDIAMYYSPINKYIVFPSVGQIRYLGHYNTSGSMGNFLSVAQPWLIEAAKEVKELRATGRCKTNAGG
jgi:hypothetical protein